MASDCAETGNVQEQATCRSRQHEEAGNEAESNTSFGDLTAPPLSDRS